MSAPLLTDIAIQALAEYVCNDDYNKINQTNKIIHPDLSNEIFSRALLSRKQSIEMILRRFSKNFFLTKVDLSDCQCDESVLSMLRNLSLVSLTIGQLEYFRNRYHYGIYIDMARILQMALNPKSSSKLRCLDISGEEKLYRGWVWKTFPMIPSLESLTIAGRSITGEDFNNLCRFFSNLRLLDVSNTVFPSIRPITQLKNLKILILRDIEFKSHHQWKSIAQLTMLQVLDVSKTGYSKKGLMMLKYLHSQIVLPQLVHMDCTGTDIDLGTLQQIMKTHKNLKSVATVGTLLSRSIVDNIDLLNVATPKSTEEALRHYIKLKRKESILMILEDVNEIWEYENDDMRRTSAFIRLILDIKRMFPWDCQVDHATNFSLSVLATEGRLEMLPQHEIFEMIDQLLVSLDYHFNESAWILLEQPHILEICRARADEVCTMALECIMNVAIPPFEYTLLPIFVIFGTLVRQMSLEKLDKIGRNWDIMNELWQLLLCWIDLRSNLMVEWCLQVLIGITERSESARNILVELGAFEELFVALQRQDRVSKMPYLLITQLLRYLSVASEVCIFVRRVERWDLTEFAALLVCNNEEFDEETQLYYNAEVSYNVAATLSTLLVQVKYTHKVFKQHDNPANRLCRYVRTIPINRVNQSLDIYLASKHLEFFLRHPRNSGQVIWSLRTIRRMKQLDMDVSKYLQDVRGYRSSDPDLVRERTRTLEMIEE
ncbi:hypothetical protein CRE_19426 [Caenorhabditis remanei]|uniref:Zer-1-like leucine-rich repeats region domain-containing protein n=1 Tax=Caenorhabditis remanei TaxID=31234 RepID=E3NA11_CAERE|nr:hypothetical protein CRE_19426 [Caenorhabditis remanei]